MAQAEENVGQHDDGRDRRHRWHRRSGDITKTGELWRAAGHGRQELAAARRRPAVCLRRRRQAVCRRRGHRQAGRQARQADRHDHALQPGLCRRQDLRLHDQRLARASSRRQQGVKLDAQTATRPTRTKCPARRSISHGRIYLPTGAQMYCLGKADAKPAATPIARAAEGNAGRPRTTSRPRCKSCRPKCCSSRAQHQKFTVRLFNARGQFLKNSTGQFLAGRSRRDQQGRQLSGRQQRPAHGHDPDGQGRRPARPGPHSRRAQAALEVRFHRRRGADHLGRRPLSPHRARRRRQQGDGQDHDDSQGHAQPVAGWANPICTTTRSRPTSTGR